MLNFALANCSSLGKIYRLGVKMQTQHKLLNSVNFDQCYNSPYKNHIFKKKKKLHANDKGV